MKKYCEASSFISSSTCIREGTAGLTAKVTAVKKSPEISTAETDWLDAFTASSFFPAPRDCDMNARKPMPRAETDELTNQFTVVVEPTAAVASVPSEPTMAVSIYCTAVCISCSSIVGHARATMTGSILKFSLCIFFENVLCRFQKC